jgi:hypothetical protein
VNENVYRVAAVAAAAALLAAPYRAQIQAAACRAVETAKEKAGLLSRLAAAALLIAAAWGKVPLPTLPAIAPAVTVETPSQDMQRLVSLVADALAGLPAADRNLWASLWTRAATVAAGDAVTAQVAFTDTRSLRDYTALAVDIGWRRIGQHAPGSQESLRTAVEAAYASALGRDVVPVTGDVRARYVEFANAIGWAATR